MSNRRSFIAGFGALLIARPSLAAKRFVPLFDGKSLSGWTADGAANWTVKDGIVSADNGKPGMLVSEQDYRDFDLRAEFWVSSDANSGVFLRCSTRTGITQSNAYEANIYDNRPDPIYGTGAIVEVATVSPMPKAGGRWNLMEISARGDVFSVIFNGQKTVSGARDNRYASGPIGLQYGGGVVRFRKVDIRLA